MCAERDRSCQSYECPNPYTYTLCDMTADPSGLMHENTHTISHHLHILTVTAGASQMFKPMGRTLTIAHTLAHLHSCQWSSFLTPYTLHPSILAYTHIHTTARMHHEERWSMVSVVSFGISKGLLLGNKRSISTSTDARGK